MISPHIQPSFMKFCSFSSLVDPMWQSLKSYMYNQERRKKLQLAYVRIASSVLLLDMALGNMGLLRQKEK